MNYLPSYMFKVFFKITFVFFIIISFSSCKDILEEDISDVVLEILVPRDGVKNAESTQSFVWNEVEGAINYRFQVAKPEFVLIDRLVIDSIIIDSRIIINLAPGKYEWRIKAQNGSSESEFITRSFEITDTTNLNSSEVFLLKPDFNGYVNSLRPEFKWDVVYNSSEYELRVYEGDFEQSDLVSGIVKTGNTSHIWGENLQEKAYYWGVRAENNLSKSLFYSRKFEVDTTIPQLPVLQSPLNNSVEGLTVIFNWSGLGNIGAPEFDSIYISSDSNQTSLIIKEESLSGIFIQVLDTGFYYWSCKRFDKAGNFTSFSPVNKFKVE